MAELYFQIDVLYLYHDTLIYYTLFYDESHECVYTYTCVITHVCDKTIHHNIKCEAKIT